MSDLIQSLTVQDFASLFGASDAEVRARCGDVIAASDVRYRFLSDEEQKKVQQAVRARIEARDFTVAGPDESARWERGWNEILAAFTAGGYRPESLTPQYFRPGEPMRLRGKYILPCDARFQASYVAIFLTWLFRTYLEDIPSVYEFGCGTGHNLVRLAHLYPTKELVGLDWVGAPKKILDLLRERRGYRTQGRVFNMFAPDRSVAVSPGSAVFTMGALELLHDQFTPFLEYVLAQKPALVIDVNSILEAYDRTDEFDELAFRYEKVRKYLDGYFSRLRALADAGKIEILQYQRVPFGSLYHDGYSFVVWKPRR